MTRSHARRLTPLLRSVFGLEQLRPGQRAVIDSVLAGRHTLAVMPTGAGKSLCYQLPALLLPGMTVVVSPLIALMRDQHDKLIALGVASAQVNSAVPAGVAREAHAQIGDEGTEFFFTTPEQLARPELRARLSAANVDLFVIDEAHCLSQWGHDFRPDYLNLADVIRSLGSPTVLALTATAPPAVTVDIVRQLALPDIALITTGAWRENLELAVRHVSGDVDKQRALVDVLRRQSGSGIVYAATVKHVHEIADLLRGEGLAATHYHGRLAARERHANQDAFMRGDIPIMVATNAFGMGIDKADIRYVVHYDLPASLDAYYQEAGRAGRDGEPAACVLLFQRADRRLQAFFMAGRYPTAADLEALLDVLPGPGDPPATLLSLRESLPAVASSKLRVLLTMLKEQRVVTERQRAGFRRRIALPPDRAAALMRAYELRAAADRGKLDAMVVYAQTALCRWRPLLESLGETVEWTQCGRCDNCRGTAERAIGAAR
ncbi:MAG: ATP-dependent DNA helicase RecQ [Vicinamibacteraceae bacterium]